MGARLFAILFVSLVVFGVWFQQSYMSTYAAEFEAQKASARTASELITVRPFRSDSWRQGRLAARVRADEARYYTNGRIFLSGNVRYEDFADDGTPRLALETRRATGQVQVGTRSGSLFDSEKRLERVDIPGEVTVQLGVDDEVRTRKVIVDFVRGQLATGEDVTLQGPGRRMQGKGFTYQIATQDFRLGGRVSGEIVPTARTDAGGMPKSGEKR